LNTDIRHICGLINLPKVEDDRGNLSFIESESVLPFTIQRTYWIYDVPGGQTRSGHANAKSHEFIVAISGSFDVVVDDGFREQVFSLNRSYFGLYIPNMVWRTIRNFSTNSLCLVLVSDHDSDTGLITSYADYVRKRGG
jgi:oxalate decarboxylase/phosphoglucose isomerase-like protein (cupin superfamily)